MQEQYRDIGETAGKVYKVLETKGVLSIASLQKETGVADVALLNQALGWLAREDKINFEKKDRAITVSLLGVNTNS